MALNFEPYPQRPRPDWQQMVLGPISQGLSGIAGIAQGQKEQKYKDLLLGLEKAKQAREAEQFKSEWGTPAPTSAVSPIYGPVTQDQGLRAILAPSSPAVAAPSPAEGGMVARFRQWQDQQRSGAAAPSPQPTGIPQPQVGYQDFTPQIPGYTPEQVRSVVPPGYVTAGSKHLETLKKLFKPDMEYTPIPGVVSGAGKPLIFNKTTGGVTEAPYETQKLTAPARPANPQATSKDLEKAYGEVERRANPALAPRGSPLGLAGVNNQRADRALAVLSNPQATDQQLAAGVVDLAAIMHGGAPDELEVKNQMYPTLQARWNRLVTLVTSQPMAARQPEIQAKIRQMVSDVKEVDNKVINDNLDSIEVSRQWMVNQDPNRWKKYRGTITQMTQGLPGATTPNPDFGPGATGGQGGYIKTASNPKTGQKIGTRDGVNWEPVQ